MSRLNSKLAIIAGADPVGHGIAHRFAKEGAAIALIDTNPRTHELIAALRQAGAHAVWIDCNTSIKSDAQQAIADAQRQLGGAHVLVNNTLGTCEFGPVETKSEATIVAGMRGLLSAVWLSQAVFPQLKDQEWGRVINIGSRYGGRMNVYHAEYSMAAWALRGLTRTLAAEWAKFNIIVNLLEVAANTPDFASYRDAAPALVDALVDQVALGRRGDPEEDIGAAAVFLACDEVDAITGQVIYADGGQHLAAPAFIPAAQLGFLAR